MKVKSNHLGSRKRRRVVLDLLFNITLHLRFDRYLQSIHGKGTVICWTTEGKVNPIDLLFALSTVNIYFLLDTTMNTSSHPCLFDFFEKNVLFLCFFEKRVAY